MTSGVLSSPVEAVRTAATLLRGVLDSEPWSVPGPDAMTLASELECAQRMLDAARLHALSILAATGECERQGHRTVAAWAAFAAHLPRSVVQQRVRMARRLRSMPRTAAALAAGQIASQHVDVLMRANSPSRAAAFADHETLLVGFAKTLSFADFVTAVAYWRNAADPSGADDEAADKCSRRSLHVSRTLDGMGRVDGWLDPIGFAELSTELERLTAIEFADDWAHARAIHGDAVTVDALGRTAAQRRADALLAMARRSASSPADARRPEPLVVILTDHATVEAAAAHWANPGTEHAWPLSGTCRLEDGTTITPAEMFEQLLLGRFRKLLMDANGAILDYGRSQRLFRGDLREAIRFRDGTCYVDSCDMPARRCEIDHITPWGVGGHTSSDDGRAACDYHNRRRHRLGGHLPPQRDPDTGHVNWTTPDLRPDDG